MSYVETIFLDVIFIIGGVKPVQLHMNSVSSCIMFNCRVGVIFPVYHICVENACVATLTLRTGVASLRKGALDPNKLVFVQSMRMKFLFALTLNVWK